VRVPACARYTIPIAPVWNIFLVRVHACNPPLLDYSKDGQYIWHMFPLYYIVKYSEHNKKLRYESYTCYYLFTRHIRIITKWKFRKWYNYWCNCLIAILVVTIIITKAGHKWKCLKRSEIVSYVVTDIASERVCHSSSFFLFPFIRNTLINDWNTIMKNNT